MTTLATFPPAHRLSDEAASDLTRVGLILAIFAAISLSIMLAATQPGSPLAEIPRSGPDWHGNVAASVAR